MKDPTLPAFALPPLAPAPRRMGLRIPFAQLRNLLFACFALSYGFVLQALPVMEFKDRANYFEYARDSLGILIAYVAQGPLTVLSNEPLWLLINIGLARLMQPESVMRVVIFVGAARFSYVLLRSNPRNAGWLMLLLFMPQLLKNFVTHLRQGLAMAIFFSGYFARGTLRRWMFMLAAPFVHASFIFILPIVVLPAMLRAVRCAVDIRLLIMAAYSIAASLSLGFVATLVGARQSADYQFEMTEVSGLGFLFWSIVLGLLILQGKSFLDRYQEAAGVLLFYLLSYFFIEVTARVFESGMPLVLLAGLALSGWRRQAFLSSLVLYGGLEWIMRLSSPTPF